MISVKEFSEFQEITITNKDLEISILTLGATLRTLKYKGRDMILKYFTYRDYLEDKNYLGSIVGRYANRIKGSEFNLDNTTYHLTPNEGANHLHGGFNSFNTKIWDYKIIDNNSIRFHLFSLDNDNGYPGNLDAFVTYELNDNKLRIIFEGLSDKKTIYGPTTHLYFNIDNEDTMLDAKLSINSNYYLKVDENNIPVRTMPCVDEFDFTKLRRINNNYDHAFILNNEKACVLRKNDIQINISTNYPAIQLYTGQFLSNGLKANSGLALEPEFYPDSPNRIDFPSPVLEANVLFNKYIEYEFSE